jgi:putative sigma-54 modulation protein
MEVNIKSIHFDATEKLHDFINKKLNRLARRFESITKADVSLKVVKPETAMNKEAAVKLTIPTQEEFYASKIADTFEEAVDLAIEALERQLEKTKERK